ncbi:hypothetical protein [Pseudoalteromonas sp. JB197]|nr:hypothetical protein [Pseudoalteromonas sp. JB197]SJN25460.1 hypothetical protein CZ797_04250 [Pseudoalteromonas sp. JB197]
MNKQIIVGTGAAVAAFAAVKIIKHFILNSKSESAKNEIEQK